MISKSKNGCMSVFTFDCDGAKTLPVFSHPEEARMFLCLGGMGGGWRVRESGAGELVSVLHALCAGVEKVALDPLPEMVSEHTVALASISRERFLERAAAQSSPHTFNERNRVPSARGLTEVLSKNGTTIGGLHDPNARRDSGDHPPPQRANFRL